ncbi:MAG TPA: glycosyltransferase family 4 protein [Candidatus Limnocylindrales bacterium]|nr:glycosyltransferase family 4 protein [Candidatus Limnocylindrales bacterium]
MRSVCFITPEYWPLTGGTGAYVYYLSNELVKNGYRIYVVTGSDQTVDIEVNKQLKVFFLKIPKTPVVKSFLFAAACYRKLNRQRGVLNVDIAHANLPLTPNFAVPANFGKTLVCTVHSTWKGEAQAIRSEPYSRLNANEKFMVSFNWFLRIFEEEMLKRANRIIAVSQFTKRELLEYYKVPESKIRVIYNGVDTHKFHPTKDKRKIKEELGFNPDDLAIVSLGRLYARKGLFTLIESIPAVVKRFRNVKFIISGKGQSDEMRKLTAYAEKVGVKDDIIFTGYYPDEKLPKLYQAADVFAFSTFYEHHPFAVLEALSTGLPVVTTNVGGIPETIVNGKNGFLVEPFNPAQFADKILYLLEHPVEAQKMGLLARKTALERFDWRIVVKAVLKVYDEALG